MKQLGLLACKCGPEQQRLDRPDHRNIKLPRLTGASYLGLASCGEATGLVYLVGEDGSYWVQISTFGTETTAHTKRPVKAEFVWLTLDSLMGAECWPSAAVSIEWRPAMLRVVRAADGARTGDWFGHVEDSR